MDLASMVSNAVIFLLGLIHVGPQAVGAVAGLALSALAISEVLPFVKKIEANGIAQLVINIFKKLAGK